MRDKFIYVDMGVFGVNVVVVEIGIVFIMINEGNGCMVGILFLIYLYVFGIEKFVKFLFDVCYIFKVLFRNGIV